MASAAQNASTQPPLASFTYSPSAPVAGEAVTLDGSGSSCPAAPCTYAWQDDGPDGPGAPNWPLGDGQLLSFTFQGVGTKYVRLTVTDSLGQTATVEHDVVVALSSPPPPPSPPTDTTLPSISGTAQVGDALAANPGSWTGSPTFAYQWQLDGTTNIAGATASGYMPVAGDVGHQLDVVVTATNAGGSTVATSAATSAVTAAPPPPPVAPTNTALPSITGTTQQGQTLTASPGTWTGTAPISYSYLWSDGATGVSDTLTAADLRSDISVTVTAANTAGSASATSAPVGPVQAPPPSSPPTDTTPPSISGTARVGDVLTANPGTWTGSPTVAYQWQRDGTTNIPGATASGYMPVANDVGHTLDVVVTGTNARGSTVATSAATSAVTAPPPAASFTYTPAAPVTGQAVTFNGSGSSCPAAPCTYAWQDDGSDGPGAPNWPLGSGQVLSFTFQSAGTTGTKYVDLTVTDSVGQTATVEHDVVVASSSSPPPAAPINTLAPAIAGTPQQGQTLTAVPGTWTGTAPISFTYLWSNGATGATDVLTAADVNRSISVTVTATNTAGNATATSVAVGPVIAQPVAPANTGLPVISGTPQLGDTLVASSGKWTGSAPIAYSYAWSDGATGSTDTLSASDLNQNISVTVTASNAAGSARATSTSVGPVKAPPSGAPTNTSAPVVSGTTQVGSTLSATTGTWTGTAPISYSYQWQRDGTTNIAGATAAAYTLTAADAGHKLDVVVTATNAGGSASQSSLQTAVIGGGGAPVYPACTQALNPGADVGSVVDGAANGAVICLDAGSYGDITLTAPHAANVTLQSVQGQTVNVGNVTLGGSLVTVRGLNALGFIVPPGASNISIVNNNIDVNGATPTSYEAILLGPSQDCTAPNHPNPGCTSVDPPESNITITGNNIRGNPGDDLINLTHFSNVDIEGNNLYGDWEDGNHDDNLQTTWGGNGLTFRKNYLHNSCGQGFFLKDGQVSHVTFEDNLVVHWSTAAGNGPFGATDPFGCNSSNGAGSQMYTTDNVMGEQIDHNTFWDDGMSGQSLNDYQNPANPCQSNSGIVMTQNVMSDFLVSASDPGAWQNIPCFVENHNIITGGWDWTGEGYQDPTDSTATPTFTNPATDDYRLATNPNGIGVDWRPADQHYGP